MQCTKLYLYYLTKQQTRKDIQCKAIRPGNSNALSKTKLLIKSSSLRLTAQELRQGSHFILRTALLEDLVSVAATSCLVHRVVLEDCVEHIC